LALNLPAGIYIVTFKESKEKRETVSVRRQGTSLQTKYATRRDSRRTPSLAAAVASPTEFLATATISPASSTVSELMRSVARNEAVP
jgi:hypothetical protein